MSRDLTSQSYMVDNSSKSWYAFAFSVPIAIVGGLIGLGGAEFRLPVLVGPLEHPVRQAVRLNLAVSMITIVTSLITRAQTLSLDGIEPFAPGLIMIVISAGVTAFAGTGLVRRIQERHLVRVIFALLLVIGAALILESFLLQAFPALVPNVLVWEIVAGILAGFAIGFVSSVLGVAGGELIIPTLIFGFGMNVKTAGTASLLISLPTVMIGVARFSRQGAYNERGEITKTIVPMGIGSILGAIIGGLVVGLVPTNWLKAGLGVILIMSAIRILQDKRKRDREHGL